MKNKDIDAAKAAVVRLSVVSNSVLVLFKLAVGLLIGSVSVLSEAIHSGIDLAAAMIAYFAVRSSARPADKEHHFGHGKFENVSGFVEAILIFLAAAWIIYEAVQKLLHPAPIELVGWGILVMGLSSFVNLAVSRTLFRVGNETDSIAIKADAWHLRTDVYTSLGVLAGLGVMWLIEKAWTGHHVHWIDPVAAIIVALMIIKAAYDLTQQSLGGLLDEALPEEDNRRISALIGKRGEVIRFKNLRTRKAGATRFIEFDIKVAAEMSVAKAHSLADLITADIENELSNPEVVIHIEPCDRDCPPDCVLTCPSPDKPGKT